MGGRHRAGGEQTAALAGGSVGPPGGGKVTARREDFGEEIAVDFSCSSPRGTAGAAGAATAVTSGRPEQAMASESRIARARMPRRVVGRHSVGTGERAMRES